jgi:hypothetical protein
MERTELAGGVVAFLMTVLVVVGLAAVGASLTGGGPTIPATDLDSTSNLSIPEYDAGDLVAEPLAVGGSIDPDVPAADRGGTVLVDATHGNDYPRETIAPLVRALTATNHTVRFHEQGDNLTRQLRAAKAYVVISPSDPHDAEEVRAVSRFTDRGGRLLLVGEPDRIEPVGTRAGGQTITITVALASLGSEHGVSFDTRYLYNLETNDGNYKHVIARPPAGSPLSNVERTTHYTATTVTVRDGTPLLVTTEGTHQSGSGEAGTYTVAAQRGNVLALGDRTFLRSDRYAVADNEAVIAHVVEFLAQGESVPGAPPIGSDTESEDEDDGGFSGP